jgi:outer membrane lipoprotein-sorting protein
MRSGRSLSPRARWAVPGVVAAAVVAGSVLAPGLASAEPVLPPTTAEQLLADVAGSDVQALSGTVVQTVDLGLPELPRDSRGGAWELTGLLTGTTTARVWSDGPQRSRVAVLSELAETDVVRNGHDAWVWRSDSSTALHTTVPTSAAGSPEAAGSLTPQQLAEQVLAAVDPSTEVALDGTTTVAGRDAYVLVLRPRDASTLVGEVRLAVDAASSVPLQVRVTPRGSSEPALTTGFTELSLTRPDPGVFAFTPPAGATVTEAPASPPARRPAAARPTAGSPEVVGQGWTAVLVLRGPGAALPAGSSTQDPTARALLDAFRPVTGAFGSGRLLTTRLLGVLALDDGRVLVGAVGPDVLERAAAATGP